VAYFDDPENFAWWQGELEVLRAERQRRMIINKKEAPAQAESELKISEPALDAPELEEPALEEPVFEEPTFEEPTFEEPTFEEPEFEEPELEEPVLEESVLEEPMLEESAEPEAAATPEVVTFSEKNILVEELPGAEKDEEVHIYEDVFIEAAPKTPAPPRQEITFGQLEKDALTGLGAPRRDKGGASRALDPKEREPVTFEQLERDSLTFGQRKTGSPVAQKQQPAKQQPAMKR